MTDQNDDRAMLDARPILICYPSSDRVFVDAVERLAEFVAEPERLERLLRNPYPHVTVRPSVLTGEPRRWYVYRDGGWMPGPSVPTRGWTTSQNSAPDVRQ